ncbi:MAG: LIM domain protein, partial [Podila humilis]
GFICSSCNEAISGMMITAMGKRWHSDHFVCTVCNTNLEHVQFFQRDGLPYCHFDYHDKFSPKCGHCNSAIENECLTALGKSWHPGHFFCRECGDPFEEDGYMVHDDFPYCEKDYLRLFAPKCAGCQDPIQGDFISALKGKWHRDCFGCTVCHIGFDTTSYYVENGKPYCQAHY